MLTYLVSGKESAKQRVVLQTILLVIFPVYTFSSQGKRFVKPLCVLSVTLLIFPVLKDSNAIFTSAPPTA